MRISDWSSDVCSSDLHVACTGIQAVIQIGVRLRQSASSHVQNIDVVPLSKALGNKPPGDCGAGNARHQKHRYPGAAVSQIMLTDSVRMEIGSVHKPAFHGNQSTEIGRAHV